MILMNKNNMKKILIIHNKYQNIGGEDIAVDQEVNTLKKYFDVQELYFSNACFYDVDYNIKQI